WRGALAQLAPPTLVVWTKRDLGCDPPGAGVFVSAATGLGLDALGEALEAALATRAAAGADVYASGRQRAHLEAARRALGEAINVLAGDDPARTELGAFEVQEALEALGALVGEVSTDDVLDRIFAQFCIGK
ncbi:MAG: tRNA uridine-5-carboxymethylaminomethyl(34) synthesis GTPase MnmE, partial [Planctomycetes bacterium]|nr:tRNA uridine-5-carboxymethylaminomethyl(34) synthesis GTPase MnmE [Planctomycetota bacterium]